MQQTKIYFPLIFISLEDDSSIIIPPQPTDPGEIMSGGEGEPVEADEPEEGENDTTPAETEHTISGVLASTETVTHEYLTQSGKVARETIRQDVSGTVLKTENQRKAGKTCRRKNSTARNTTFSAESTLRGAVTTCMQQIRKPICPRRFLPATAQWSFGTESSSMSICMTDPSTL